MGKQVKVRVSSIGEHTGGESIVTNTFGNLLYKEPYYYLSYEEKLDEESSETCKSTLRYNEHELRVTRKGNVTSTLEFSKGQTHKSIYMSPYGNFEVEVYTKNLTIECKEKSATMVADYTIGFNGMTPNTGKLEISVSDEI